MTRHLDADGWEHEIADYLMVCPITFGANRKLALNVRDMGAMVNLVSAGMQAQDADWSSLTDAVRDATNFTVMDDDGENILKMTGFEVAVAHTPACLDARGASWLLKPVDSIQSPAEVEFHPGPYDGFTEFGGGSGNWIFGGTEVSGDGKVLLRASLSAPVYRTSGSQTILKEYAAFGPANSQCESDRDVSSLFQWMIGQAWPDRPGRNKTGASRSVGRLRQIVVRDVRSARSHTLFDAQMPIPRSGVAGALFVASGAGLLNAPWRSLLSVVRAVASVGRRSATALSDGLDPAWQFGRDFRPVARAIDLVVSQTSQQRQQSRLDSTDSTIDSMDSTIEYEGILLWDLDVGGDDRDSGFLHL